MKKWLVKIHYKYDDILNEETQEIESVKTNEIDFYTPKYMTDSRSLPRGGDFMFCESSEDVTIPIMGFDDENNPIVIQNEATQTLREAWSMMDKEIVSESAKKIGTLNRESMLAFVDAYQLRMAIPEKYLSIGLIAEIEIGTFLQGDSLDTVEKIKEYYSEVLFSLDIHRISKIQGYLTLKAQLGF